MPKRQARGEVRAVRLSIIVDEGTWRALRDAAVRERPEGKGRASINALVGRLIAEYLGKQKRGAK